MRRYVTEPADKPVLAELREDGDGGVTLLVGDWAVIRLTPEGRLVRETHIARDNEEGLEVDRTGSVKFVGE